MKKILYSSYTKFIAFILCALSVAVASYIVTTNFFKEDNIYLFENSYEESYMAGNKVNRAFYSISDRLEDTMDDKGRLHPDQIKNMPSPDEWECYIKTENGTYTNLKDQADEDYDKFSSSILSVGVQVSEDKNNKGVTRQAFSNINTYDGYYFIDDDNGNGVCYELCVRMSPKLIEKNKAEWIEQKLNADGAAKKAMALLIFAAALFIYLLCVTGKKYGSDEIQMMLLDKMFVEITAALFLGVFLGLGALIILGAGYFIIDEAVMIANALSAVAIFAVISLSLLLFLSLVRNLKNGTFTDRSMIVRIWKFAWKWFKKICKFLLDTFIKICKRIKRGLSTAKRTVLTVSAKNFDGKFVGIIIVVYSILAAVLFCIGLEEPMFMLLFILLIVSTVWFTTKRLVGFYNLKNGIEKIKNGDLNHKIEGCPDGVIGFMAENINSIGDGLQKSLENEVRAERMKSELITNVSHDLKTPLTSIINYTDLLSQEELTPPEANDYVKIIKQKSERLKQLTSDLFDISRAQSGNEEFNLEDIDLCLLISQAMAELNAQIEQSGLVFKIASDEKEIFVRADGKKMSRVFENLLNNCVKYAMKNTRVYINIARTDAGAAVEIKNIAGYDMDFDETEITERFVRGDSARSTEGSGLGLAIVKSYVEGCGGRVEVKKDGDLFKVILNLKKA